MMTATANVSRFTPKMEEQPEDGARAGLYALVAHLFYSPPSAQLLSSIADADTADGADAGSRLAAAWRDLRQAAAGADAAAVKQEYDNAFVSIGRAPVFLLGSFYVTGFLMEKPLVQLREDLARLGLSRKETSFESEDHISALCDVMRFLIAGDGVTAPAALAAQRDFFRRHLQPWYPALCAAIETTGETDFYKKVAALARAFFDLEVEAFEIA